MGGPGSGPRKGGGGPYSRVLKNTGIDKKSYNKFKSNIKKGMKLSKKGAEDVAAMYSHQFRKYK
jgi:hypothetical protein